MEREDQHGRVATAAHARGVPKPGTGDWHEEWNFLVDIVERACRRIVNGQDVNDWNRTNEQVIAAAACRLERIGGTPAEPDHPQLSFL